ncbi:hypothetical protein DSECCO2_263070 [anaerobic digester metagenome]
MKFFIYSRKSVYTGKGESIDNQIEMCKQYVFTKFPDATVNDFSIYEDEGFSAKNTERPKFQQMLRDIKLKKPDYVVCYRLDRISRNVSDFSTLIEELNQRSISFICIKEEFDTSKPMGKAMMYIASVFAQLERETIAERVRDNMVMLARTGRWLGGTTPTGYTSEKIQEIIIDGKIKTSCKLKDNPPELLTVDCIFEKYLEYKSISGVSKYLISQNMKSRSGKFYSLLGIKDILQNPVYCMADQDARNYFVKKNADVCFEEKDCSNIYGLISYNKRDYKKKHAPRQSVDKWIISIGRHKGRIEGKKWVAIQAILEENIPTGKNPSKIHNDYSLLSGLIYCDNCGGRMFAKHRSGKKGNSALFDYICHSKLCGGKNLCDCQNLNGQETDDAVCRHLMEYFNEYPSVFKLLENLKRDIQKEETEYPLERIQANIKKCNEEMDNLVNSISENKPSTILLEKINSKMQHLEQDLIELEQKQYQIQQEILATEDQEQKKDLLVSNLSNLKGNFSGLTIQEKRTFIKLLIHKIIWDGENLHIFIYSEK